MGVDMDEADRPLGAERFEDRIGDRVVAADREGPHPGRTDARIERGDILDRIVEAEPRAQRHIADVGDVAFAARGDFEGVVVRADAFYVAHRPRSQPGAGAVGDAEIHRHADQCHIEPGEIGQIGRIRPIRCVQKGGEPGIGHRAAVGAAEHQGQGSSELLGRDLGLFCAVVFGAQRVELCLVEHAEQTPRGGSTMPSPPVGGRGRGPVAQATGRVRWVPAAPPPHPNPLRPRGRRGR